MDFLSDYAMFLLKSITVVIAIGASAIIVIGTAFKQKHRPGSLTFDDLSSEHQSMVSSLKQTMLGKKEFKHWQKSHQDQETPKCNLFVLDFCGSTDAREVEALREEVTAILAVATPQDEVMLRLESGGGEAHSYGLAASQLERFTQKQIPLTVAIDKLAASGGYMMACVAQKIIAAPFSIVGSIGVVAQVPNFHKLLKKSNVDVEQFTAGEFKRTVSMFAENTDKGRSKFQQELDETHSLFKEFVKKNRPALDIETVATGEHWFGFQALQHSLVDSLVTSDDYLLQQMNSRQVYLVKYKIKKRLAERAGLSISALLTQLWQQANSLVIWR